MTVYEEFVASKRHTTGQFGFEPQFMPECAFDFQPGQLGA